MLTYLVAFLISLGISGGLTPLVALLAVRNSWFDLPSERRKIHTHPIPRIGGIGIAIAFFVPLLGLSIYTNRISGLLYAETEMFVVFSGCGMAILALGVFDDLRGADAKLKLTVQSMVAVVMWIAGFRIHLLGNPFGPTIQLEMLSLPLTILWIVGVVNALNLIDGLDGLASGIGLFACIVLFGVAFADHAALLCLITVSLSGALIGFLFFNSNPARIFLGDSGSMFLGFALASVSIWTQRKGATAVALLIPVMALGVPILDTTLSVVRRLARRQNPFHADRDHIHHRLLALGLSHRHAVFTLYTLSGVFGLGALAMLKNDTTTRTIVLSTVAVAVFVLVRKIGIVPPPSFFSGAFGSIRDQARGSARAIRRATTPDGAWQEVLRFLQHTTPEVVRLAWSLPVDASQRRESVFEWRADNSKNWVFPGSSRNENRALRFILSEGDDTFGELIVLHQHRHRLTLEEQVAFQLIRDALIDFCVDEVPRKNHGTVVHLARDVATR